MTVEVVLTGRTVARRFRQSIFFLPFFEAKKERAAALFGPFLSTLIGAFAAPAYWRRV